MSVIDLIVVPGEMSGGSIHRFKKRIQRWRLLNPKRLARLVQTPEQLSSFWVHFLVMWPVEYVQQRLSC